MGIDSDGPAAIALERKCLTLGCNNTVQATGPGNHKYCNDCKKARTPSSSKQKNKRDNSAMSPLESVQAKITKEDDFPFEFNTAFGCDFETFVSLDRDEQVVKFKELFFNNSEKSAAFVCETSRLSDQIRTLTSQLTTAKLALADKQIQLFEATRTADPVSNFSGSSSNNDSALAKVTTKATVVKRQVFSKPIDTRPTLVARLCKDIPTDNVSVGVIDSMLGLQQDGPDGPIVQQFKKVDGRVTLTFRDAVARNKAKELISNSCQQGVFQSVYIPQKTYPAIARLSGLSDVQSITGDDIRDVKKKQGERILELIGDENSFLKDLVSVRILSNRPESCSFLVRLGLSTKSGCDQLLEKGRILIGGGFHAVVEADPSKEIRHCSRCQKYGHLATFCKATVQTCRKCTGQHASDSCAVQSSSLNCANCSRNHAAGSKLCPVHSKAVSQYLSYIST